MNKTEYYTVSRKNGNIVIEISESHFVNPTYKSEHDQEILDEVVSVIKTLGHTGTCEETILDDLFNEAYLIGHHIIDEKYSEK